MGISKSDPVSLAILLGGRNQKGLVLCEMIWDGMASIGTGRHPMESHGTNGHPTILVDSLC